MVVAAATLARRPARLRRIARGGSRPTSGRPSSVAKVARGDLSQALTLAAEFRPFQEIDVHAKVAGYVKSINVDVGDRVRAGQLLAVLEIPELQDDIASRTRRRHGAPGRGQPRAGRPERAPNRPTRSRTSARRGSPT